MQELVPQASWWRRHWKRLAFTVFSIVLLASVIVFVWFNNSEAKNLAVASATSNRDLVTRVGEPIRFGWFIGGEIEETPGFGRAELTIPVSGPKGTGTLYVAAVKEAGIWKLTLLQFGPKDSMERLQ